MQMFFYLVVAALLIYFLFSFFLPPAMEDEEEEEVWDAAELRLESLLQGVVDPRVELRERYRNRILAMGPGVIPRLTEALSQELFLAQNEIRIVRIKELLRDFGLRAVPPLLQMLEEEGGDPEVARAVQELLLDLGSVSLSLVVDRLSPTTVMPLLPVLQAWGESSLKAVMKAFAKNPSQSMWRRVLLSFGESAVPHLLAAMEQGTPEARGHAFQILSEFAPEEARPIFLEELESRDPLLRACAVQALGKLGDPAHFDLVAARLDDPKSQVRVAAIESVASIGGEGAIEPLQDFLHADEEPELLEAVRAAVKLTELGVEVPQSYTDKALSSASSRLRMMGLQLVRCAPEQERYEYLERLLHDLDERMVQETIRTLASLKTRASIQLLIDHSASLPLTHPGRGWIEDALVTLQEEATPFLLPCLEGDDLVRVGLALRVLMQGDDPHGVEPILLALQGANEPDDMWGIEPEDLHLYLQRVALRTSLKDVLQHFLREHPNSPLAPALTLFLSQMNPSDKESSAAPESKFADSP